MAQDPTLNHTVMIWCDPKSPGKQKYAYQAGRSQGLVDTFQMQGQGQTSHMDIFPLHIAKMLGWELEPAGVGREGDRRVRAGEEGVRRAVSSSWGRGEQNKVFGAETKMGAGVCGVCLEYRSLMPWSWTAGWTRNGASLILKL